MEFAIQKLIGIILGIFFLQIFFLIENKSKELRGRMKLKEYEINMNLNIGIEIIEQLDAIITDTFNEYIALNIEFREIYYVNADLEDVIIREVSKNVVDKMSPVFIDKLALIYNKKNFSKLISEKVYLHTLNYTLTKNSMKEK